MRLCSSCSHFFAADEPHCPFCGPPSWGGASTAAAALSLGLMLGLGITSCNGNEGNDSTTTASDDLSGSYYAGPTATDFDETFDPGTTTAATSSTPSDTGGSTAMGSSSSGDTGSGSGSTAADGSGSGSDGTTGGSSSGGNG